MMIGVATVILLLLAVNGLYVAAEFALVGSRPSRLQRYADEGHPLAPGLLDLVHSPARLDGYFSTSQVGISLASLGLAMYGEESLLTAFAAVTVGVLGHHAGHLLAWLLALGLLTYLHIVLGEMVPKTVALANAEGTAFRVAVPMMLSRVVFWPVVTPLAWSGRAILRLLRIPNPGAHERIFSADELGMVISQSTEGGLLSQGRGRMLLAIFDFGEHTASDLMTPTAQLEALPVDTPWRDLPDRLAASRHQRCPVYDGSPDNLVGVLYVKDVLRAERAGRAPASLREVLRQPLVVPPDTPIERLLDMFRKEHTRIAVVRGAGGRTQGVVTLGDIARGVVGDLSPE